MSDLQHTLEDDKQFFERFARTVQEVRDSEETVCSRRKQAIAVCGAFMGSTSFIPHIKFVEAVNDLDVCARYDRKIMNLFEKDFDDIFTRLTTLQGTIADNDALRARVLRHIKIIIHFENYVNHMKARIALEQNFVNDAKKYLNQSVAVPVSNNEKMNLELSFTAYLHTLNEEAKGVDDFLDKTSDLPELVDRVNAKIDNPTFAVALGLAGAGLIFGSQVLAVLTVIAAPLVKFRLMWLKRKEIFELSEQLQEEIAARRKLHSSIDIPKLLPG